MNLNDAYQLLGLSPDSTEEERHAAYKDRRDRLEAKMVKAPTEGLKSKYRESIRQMEAAIELLEESLDGGDLPTLTAQHEELRSPIQPEVSVPSEPQRRSPAPRRKSGKGVLIGAIIVVVAAGAGGYSFWNSNRQVSEVKDGLDALRDDADALIAEIQSTKDMAVEMQVDYVPEDEDALSGETIKRLSTMLRTAAKQRDRENWSDAWSSMQSAEDSMDELRDAHFAMQDGIDAALEDQFEEYLDPDNLKVSVVFEDALPIAIPLIKSGRIPDINNFERWLGGDPTCAFGELVIGMLRDGRTYDQIARHRHIAEVLLEIPDIEINRCAGWSGDRNLARLIDGYGATADRRFPDTTDDMWVLDAMLSHPSVDLTGALTTAFFWNRDDVVDRLLEHPGIGEFIDEAFVYCAGPLYLSCIGRLVDHPELSASAKRTALAKAKESPGFDPFDSRGMTQSENRPRIIALIEASL
jgi:hypothetical protein